VLGLEGREQMAKEIYGADYLTDLVNKYTDMVLRLALTYLGNFADAQDICQEIFLKLYKNQKNFIDEEHEKAWILRVTINACKDVIRSPWSRLFQIPAELPSEIPEDLGILSAVLKLPPKYRIVIYLYYYEGYKLAEISNILNIKEGTLRTQLKRAKELLRISIHRGNEDDI
jgi:RNA polymerase sigma-70 factor (ECF subfamily)